MGASTPELVLPFRREGGQADVETLPQNPSIAKSFDRDSVSKAEYLRSGGMKIGVPIRSVSRFIAGGHGGM